MALAGAPNPYGKYVATAGAVEKATGLGQAKTVIDLPSKANTFSKPLAPQIDDAARYTQQGPYTFNASKTNLAEMTRPKVRVIRSPKATSRTGVIEMKADYMDAKFIKKLSAGDITLNEEILSAGAVDKIKVKGKDKVPAIADKYESDGNIFTAILGIFKKEEEETNVRGRKARA